MLASLPFQISLRKLGFVVGFVYAITLSLSYYMLSQRLPVYSHHWLYERDAIPTIYR